MTRELIVAQTYAALWQVELICKELKSHYRLEELPTRKAHIVETLLLGASRTRLDGLSLWTMRTCRWIGVMATDADWMGDRRLVMVTDVARELDWLLHTELLQLPYRQGAREEPRDTLAETVFADARIETASRVVYVMRILDFAKLLRAT